MFRDRTRSAKRLARRIADSARRRGDDIEEARRELYGRLLGIAGASLRQAGRVREMLPDLQAGLARELERFEGLVGRVVSQARRRLLQGESVPAAEKVVSVF